MNDKPALNTSFAMVLGDIGRHGLSGKELSVLIALASHLGPQNPRTCWPQVPTVAGLAECSVKTAEKAITRFKTLTWLTSEPQRDARGYVCGARYTFTDRAPLRYVYGEARKPDPRDGGSGLSPDPRDGGSGGAPDPRNRGRQTRETGAARPASSRVQEETREETLEETTLSSAARFAADVGITEREAHLLIQKTRRDHPSVHAPLAYLRKVRENGDLPDWLADIRPQPVVAVPDWCGKCDEYDRQEELDGRVRRCPRCHPHGKAAS